MTHIISYATDSGILMASDSRMSWIEINNKWYYADCAIKTFYSSTHKIGISWYGNGHFRKDETSTLFSIDHFCSELEKTPIHSENIWDKMERVFEHFKENLKGYNKGNFLVGFICGYQNNIASYRCFCISCSPSISECITLKPGDFVEKELKNAFQKNGKGFKNSTKAQNHVLEIMEQKNSEEPDEIGGPINILKIFSDNNFEWIHKNPNVIDKTVEELKFILENTPIQYNRFNMTPMSQHQNTIDLQKEDLTHQKKKKPYVKKKKRK
ncbi:MAG: hypothetical protein ACKOXB_05315 [Flavobacteriales bacterium]